MRFSGFKAILAVVAALTLVGTDVMAQGTGTIRGVVMDVVSSRPLANAQVFIPDASGAAGTYGTLTDAQGRFTLSNVPAGQQTVRVNLIGYAGATRTVNVASGQVATANFRVQEEALQLEELVVTGVVGATPKAKLPFTVSQVNAADIPVPAVSAGAMIQGKVAGATVVTGSGRPGASPSVMLRGPTSINAEGRDQEPLYIVDGVILGSSIVDIEAMDIESIEVVKGAAAASLYGSRAANGVIQIRTKTGSSVAGESTRFTFRSEYGTNELAGSYPLARNHSFQMNAANTAFVDKDGVEFSFVEESRRYARGEVPRQPVASGSGAWNTYQDKPWPGQTFNHVERFFDPGSFNQNYLGVEGRAGGTNYHASFSRMAQGGVVTSQDGFERNSFRVNLDQGFAANLQLSTRAYYSKSSADGQNIEGGGSPLFTLTRMPAGVDLNMRDENGDLLIRPDYTRENANPLYTLLNEDRIDDRQRFLGGANLRWSATTWLDFDGNLSYDRSDVAREQYNFKGFLTARPSSLNDGYLYHDGWLNEALNASTTATVRRSFGDLNTRSQVRYLYEGQHYEFTRASGYGQTVSDLRTLRAFDKERRIDSEIEDVRSEGYFFITNLDFRDRYIVDALVRRDGSSLFGANERWQTYYRGAFAWRVSEEPFMAGAKDVVDNLKLRYSIGSAGGRPRFNAQYETYNVSLDGQVTGAETLGNANLKPEFAIEHEMGVDARLLDRFDLGLTYARTEARDQILPVPLPAFTGFSTQWQNAGTLNSNTIEASLEANILQSQDFVWSSRLLFDRTRQEITELSVAPFQFGFPTRQGLEKVFYAREGEPLGRFYGTRWATSCSDLPAENQAACANGEFQTNDDGYLVWVGAGNSWREGISKSLWGTEGPAVRSANVMWGAPIVAQDADGETFLPIGKTQPDFNFSVSNTMSWKGFSLYGLVDATMGVNVYNLPRHWAYFENSHADQDQAGKSDETKKPLGYYGSAGLYRVLGPANSHFVEDGSFVKLREVSLRYRFGADQLDRVPVARAFEGIGLSLVGRNLKTWTDYSGYDPEVGLTGGQVGSAAISRFDGYTYPNFRTWTAAVELTF